MDNNCCILQNLKKCRMEKGRCTHKNLTVKKYPRAFIVERCLSSFLFFLFFLISFLFFLSFRPCLKTCKEIYIFFFFCIRFRSPRNRKSSQGHFVCFPFAHSLFCKFVLFLLSLNCTKIQEIYLLYFTRFRKLDVNGPIGEDCTWFNFVRKSISV